MNEVKSYVSFQTDGVNVLRPQVVTKSQGCLNPYVSLQIL